MWIPSDKVFIHEVLSQHMFYNPSLVKWTKACSRLALDYYQTQCKYSMQSMVLVCNVVGFCLTLCMDVCLVCYLICKFCFCFFWGGCRSFLTLMLAAPPVAAASIERPVWRRRPGGQHGGGDLVIGTWLTSQYFCEWRKLTRNSTLNLKRRVTWCEWSAREWGRLTSWCQRRWWRVSLGRTGTSSR